ncbi:MAG TPA: hypothetical protein VMB49_03400 [Acidobacteriaceae bacterium]|nr:hypothetical protein [Acidobacteriaceae bacterium]
MTVDQFRATVHESEPPASLSPLLRALWWDAKGNFDQAHKIAQDDPSSEAAWVHAYLHRKEGDHPNASYWYRQARQAHPKISSDEEWRQIATALLEPHFH